MSNVSSRWLWKKKKDKSKIPKRQVEISERDSGSWITYVRPPDYQEKHWVHRRMKPTYRNNSLSLSKDPEFLKRLFGLNPDNEIQSFPPSQVRKLSTAGYSSNENEKYLEATQGTPLKATTTIYAASVPQDTGVIPKPTESEEPFPFQVPEDAVPRRSSLFYGVKYEDDPRLVAEKPVDDHDKPSTSQYSRPSQTMGEPEDDATSESRKRVTINTSTMGDEYINFLDSDGTKNTSMKSEAVRRTVVRFRPQSSGNFTSRESVKYMSVRAEQPHPPSELSKHVHKIPMKPPKQTPVLSTIDGRTLHPVSKDKVRRASLSVERESQTSRRSFDENKIRISSMTSEGYSKPMRMSVIVPRTGENNLTDFVRPPEMQTVYAAPVIKTRRSVGRPSTRQSILCKGSEGYSEPMRMSVIDPRTGENDLADFVRPPEMHTVYTAPVIQTRRSVGRPSIRQSILCKESEGPTRMLVMDPRTGENDLADFVRPPEMHTVYAAPVIQTRRSVGRPSIRQSILSKESIGERRNSSVLRKSTEMQDNLPFNQENPIVFRVTPSRGRSRSILQQSVRSLTSKKSSEPVVHRKNIRYSTDTDVFSATTPRRSTPMAQPGFVNMERGQPMLVSEVLNPITSLFVTDLKDPVPKDPLTRPKESNNWVNRSNYNRDVHRASIQVTKPIPQAVRQEGKTRTVPVHRSYYEAPKAKNLPARRIQRKEYSKYRDDSSSESDESMEVYSYRKKSRPSVKRWRNVKQAVYTAQIPIVTFTNPTTKKRKSSLFKKSEIDINITPEPSVATNNYCGLKFESTEENKSVKLQESSNHKVDSSAQTTNEEEMGLLCYPSDNFLKQSTLAAESGSKLKWRLIIKREDNNN